MRTKKSLLPILLLGVALVAGAVVAIAARGEVSYSTGQMVLKAVAPATAVSTATSAQGTSRFVYGSKNIVGASDAELTYFVRDWANHQLKPKGEPEVLFAKSVSYDEMPVLGLGCPPNFAAIEEPPLMVAIVRGEFDYRGAAPGFGQLPPPTPGKKSYVMYIFDEWAGVPAAILPSENGALVKKALNDPTLPDGPEGLLPSVCPTRVPASQKYLHYGQAAPGFTVPSQPTQQFPNAGTPAVPVPVETTVNR
ncbi:MAG: hypothetical protein IVW55_04180 [Chloroflexi bacterium]|nr:hypothetical protein [Chloroflexota bacterium]